MADCIQRHRLIVGVDYGTTFSGLAFGDTVNEKVEACARYPGSGNFHDEKTPSELSYDKKAPRGYLFGREITRPRLPRQRWTKLLLDEEYENDVNANSIGQNSRTMFDSHLNQPLPPGKDACDVVADYLTVLHDHAMTEQEKNLTEDVLKNTPIDWVLTVPAVWSDRAVSLTLEAAAQAGIGQRQGDTISLVSEPEAAAICAIQDLQERTQHRTPFRVGDQILICDAGGGTVDLITYEIVQVTPKLRITETVVGSGAKCGSVFIDQQFHDLLRNKIGDTRYRSIGERQMTTLMKEFEEIKRSYGSGSYEEDIFYLPLPGLGEDSDAGLEMDDFLLENDDLRACFKHVVDQIIGLVQGQITKVQDKGNTVKNIILVGGFGQSEYLFKALKQKAWGDHPDIEVLQPTGAWSAIARGAVLKGKHGSLVDERKSRRSYGSRTNMVFDPKKHAQEDAFYSTDTGLKMARNQVSWILTKGTTTDGVTKHSLKCSTTFQKGEYPRRRGTTLVASDSDSPPTCYNDPSVYDVCFLLADLSSVPESEFEEQAIGDMSFLMAEFTIELTKDSADLHFELCYKGNSYGSVKTTYR